MRRHVSSLDNCVNAKKKKMFQGNEQLDVLGWVVLWHFPVVVLGFPTVRVTNVTLATI